ncbi:beta-lactamase-like protein [Gautieria morchelliformis]|nr:beta-lactamase-like protein [Gautieria morchelliformis]
MSHWSATCISSESSDTNLSILVDCNASRYLFNCGEGTTRTLLQRKKGFRKFTALFTTGIDSDRSSGLPGLLMTVADSGVSSLNVFGPAGLDHYLASTRLYTMRESLSLKSHEIATTSSSPVCSDENLSVFAVPSYPEVDGALPASNHLECLKRKHASDVASSMHPSKRKKLDSDDLDDSRPSLVESTPGAALWNSPTVCPSELTGENAALWRRLVVQHIFPGKSAIATSNGDASASAAFEPRGRRDSVTMTQLNKPLPRLTRKQYTLSYIVVGARGRGKFDTVKAQALGLKNGPLRGRLAKGETIVTAEGKTITPDMVLGPAPQPDAMIFIDCPSTEYIPSLTGSEVFSRFQHGGEYPVHCMFHLVAPEVLDDLCYRRWLETFGDKVHHLVAGKGLTPDRITFTSSAYAQLRLSHLDSDIFRVPKCLPTPPSAELLNHKDLHAIRHDHFVAMKPAKAPVLPADDDGIDLFHPAIQKGGDRNVSSLLKPKTIETFHEARQTVARDSSSRVPQPGDDVRVTPLGTSSAMPSKYRNVSSILVQIPGSGSILLDCGEGTVGQLRRHFGEETSSILRGLSCIFISHIHGDHHIGLSKLLAQRRKLDPPCDSPIYLIANHGTLSYIQEYSDLEDLGLNDPTTGVRLIYSESVHRRWRSNPARSKSADDIDDVRAQSSLNAIRDLQSNLGLVSIVTVEVRHRGRCYGLVLKHRDGWSIVYSGDTQPTENLVRAGYNATLLIHEATLGDDQAEAAALKAHSTIGQAIDIAKRHTRMKAKNVLLTHFSTRFPKTPQMTSAPADATDPTIAIAFDHVTVSIGNLWKLNRYLPAIEQSFLDSEDPEEEIIQAEDAP